MSELIEESDNKDILIVSFGGFRLNSIGGLPPFEFLKTLTDIFPTCSKRFYRDFSSCWYHKGFSGLTVDIESSLEYLKNVIKPYKKVIFF